MSQIKGKVRICQSKINDFNVELINGSPFYNRYEEIRRVFMKYLPGVDVNAILAQPLDNAAKGTVDWYIPEPNEAPDTLESLRSSGSDEYVKYREIKERTVAMIHGMSGMNDKESQFVNCVLKYLDVDYIDDVVYCYDDKISFGVWGMGMRTGRELKTVITDDVKDHRIHTVSFLVQGNGKLEGPQSFLRKHGHVLQGAKDIPVIVPEKHFSFVEWLPEAPQGKSVTQDVTYTAVCKRTDDYMVEFKSTEGGSYAMPTVIYKKEGETIAQAEVPFPTADAGYHFKKWEPVVPVGAVVNDDMVFTAVYEKDAVIPEVKYNILFDAGENGVLEGANAFVKNPGEILTQAEVPVVKPNEGYEFTGWDASPENWSVQGDKTFVAQYKKKRLPWYKRLWLWLTGHGCFKWLLIALGILLTLLLLALLMRGCVGCSSLVGPGGCTRFDGGGCSRFGGDGSQFGSIPSPIGDKPWVRDEPGGRGGIYNPGDPYNRVETPGGYEDILPPEMGVLPPVDTANLVRDPDRRTRVVDNLLNIIMENEDKSILDLARDFKEKYPENKYQIVYYDDVVKRMQISVPSEEKEQLKQEIPGKFAPEYELFVFDESLFISGYVPKDPAYSESDKSWYFKMVHAEEAWDITKGSERLTVAIVDNGFSLKHPELSKKVVMPYNVWTHDKNVFAQSIDHGTHVAGTALAVMDNGKGLCGIAPNCAFMPVQVADRNGTMTTTSVLDGVLYALYQGADVINVSLGLEMVSGIPESVQKELQDNYFKEEERLWNRVMKIADKHKAIIVVAAGNNDILAGVSPLNRPKNFIVVSAVDKNNNALDKAEFSNYGHYSTVSAPGVKIYSTYGNKDYKTMDGTSMAAPIVTGAVALMRSLDENITPEQVACVLQGTGLPVAGDVGNLIQIKEALDKVKAGEYQDCTSTPETPSTGDVQLLLSWNDYNDLDVACADPNGDVVSFQNRRVRSGGILEIDMNVKKGHSKTPIENIYWPAGGAPFGTYHVMVWMYKQHESNIPTSPYKLKVVHGDKIDELEGTVSVADGKNIVFTFTLGEGDVTTSPNRPVVDPGNGESGSGNNTDRKNELLRRRERLQQQLDEINNELKDMSNN